MSGWVPALLEKKHQTAVASFIFAPQRSGGVVNIEIADRDEGKIYPQMSVVHRLFLGSWEAEEGAYVLVDPVPTAESEFNMYVGESTRGGVGGRIKTHVSDPPAGMQKWLFAVALHGEQQSTGINEIEYKQVQALECYLFEKLEDSKSVKLRNSQKPTEPKLIRAEIKKLESFADYVVNVLGVLGYETGAIEVGTKLVSVSPRYPCEAKIVDGQGNVQVLRYGKDAYGNWEHELSNDPAHRYQTLSGATKPMVTLGGANNDTNGWTFWHLASYPKISMNDIRDQYNKNIVKQPKVKKPSRKRSPQISSVRLSDLIQAGYIQIGAKLVSTTIKHPCEARIVDAQGNVQVLRYGKDAYGNWEHELSNDPAHRYLTLSAATNPVVTLGGVESRANGWTFWQLADPPGTILKDIREKYERGNL